MIAMKYVGLTIALIISIQSLAQTNYYRYDSKTGTSEKVGYSEPVNNNNQFAPYVPRYDVNLYGELLREKQQKFERNHAALQELINDISEEINELDELAPESATALSNVVNEYLQRVAKQRPDYSDYNVYNSIRNTLLEYKNYAKKLKYQYYRENVNSKVLQR